MFFLSFELIALHHSILKSSCEDILESAGTCDLLGSHQGQLYPFTQKISRNPIGVGIDSCSVFLAIIGQFTQICLRAGALDDPVVFVS